MIACATTSGRAGIVALTSSIALIVSVPAQPSRGMVSLAVREARLSPDGSAVVFTLGEADRTASGASGAGLWRVPFAGGGPDRLLTDDCGCAHVRWSPDGRQVAFLSRSRTGEPARVRWLPASGGTAEWVTDPQTDVSSFEWSPDGRRIAYVGGASSEATGTGNLWIRDLSAASLQARRVEDAGSVSSLSWSPSGQAIAVVTRRPPTGTRVLMIPIAGRPREISSDTSPADDVAWSPDGKLIAWRSTSGVGNQDAGRLLLIAADGGAVRILTMVADGSVQHLSWISSSRISLVLAGNRERHVDVVDVATGERVTVVPPGVADITGAPSWNGDGSRYVVVGSTPEHQAEVFAGSWPQPSPRGPDTVGAPPPPVRRITFSNR